MYLELLNLLPEVYLTSIIMILVVYGVLTTSKSTLGYQAQETLHIDVITNLTILTMLGTFYLLTNSTRTLDYSIGMFTINETTTILTGFLILVGIIFILMIKNLIKRDSGYNYEYLMLGLCAILGMIMLMKANDMISMYLALELQSLAFYVLAAYRRTSLYGTESGLKYYVMGGLSSCILLLGMAIMYGITGLTQYDELSLYVSSSNSIAIVSALLLITIGFLFKLAAAPFHMWAPDVYEGAPLASTAFFSIVPKIAIVYAMIRLLSVFSPEVEITNILAIVAMLSIIIGTVEGLAQKNIKRLLSYSSINHVGFILIGITVGATNASIFYVIIYLIMTIGMFAILTAIKTSTSEYLNKPYFKLINMKNLGIRQPFIAVSLAIVLFSMAGVPPLAGFYSKYYVLYNAIEMNYIVLALIGITGSAIAAVYYIKIIQLMYFNEPQITMKQAMNYEVSSINSIIISIMLGMILFGFIKMDKIIDLITG